MKCAAQYNTWEMRFRCLVSLFLLASLGSGVLFCQETGAPALSSHPVITDISVRERPGGVDIEITSTEPAAAEETTLEHPDRLVFDFRGCQLSHSGFRRAVNRGTVQAVRAAVFSDAPPIARVVVDLKSPQEHEELYAGNKLIIKLNFASGAGVAVQSTKATAPPNIQPVPIKPLAAETSSNLPVEGAAATPGTPSPKSLPRNESSPNHAYALLDRARGLSVSDLEPLEAKAQAGDPESETTLALAYHAGTLLKVNDGEALRLLREAASRGYTGAEEAMGIFCQMGFGMSPDKLQAMDWYTKAAEQGSRDAATNLALMFSVGDGIPKDPVQAVKWFRAAAEAGDATAQLNLSALYHRGEDVPRDDAQAAVWLTKAAEQRFAPAMLELARWNLRPEHGGNIDSAITWFKKVAETGDATAQAELGDVFVNQELGRVDYVQAVLWYRKAAEQGHRQGQFGLGARYLLGQGVPQDFAEARRWLTPAADRGHPNAQFLLARMFEAGDGGAADPAAAAKYYELAANYGLPAAQYRLGLMLASDTQNSASVLSAYKWLVLAQDVVKESAAPAQNLRKQLTPAQVTEAEREIDEWRTAHARRD